MWRWKRPFAIHFQLGATRVGNQRNTRCAQVPKAPRAPLQCTDSLDAQDISLILVCLWASSSFSFSSQENIVLLESLCFALSPWDLLSDGFYHFLVFCDEVLKAQFTQNGTWTHCERYVIQVLQRLLLKGQIFPVASSRGVSVSSEDGIL